MVENRAPFVFQSIHWLYIRKLRNSYILGYYETSQGITMVFNLIFILINIIKIQLKDIYLNLFISHPEN